jgi:hypothetical protein
MTDAGSLETENSMTHERIFNFTFKFPTIVISVAEYFELIWPSSWMSILHETGNPNRNFEGWVRPCRDTLLGFAFSGQL